MLTGMTEDDWATVLRVFAASCSRRGAKGPQRPPLPGGDALFHRPQHHLASPARGFRSLELSLEALLAPEPGGRVRGLLRRLGGSE
jgi:hypothetical protein